MGDIVKNISYIQRKLQKYTSLKDEPKLKFYLSKLKHMPIEVSHLEATGIGRSVNILRHFNGSVGERAKSLVSSWKNMVNEEEEAKRRAEQDQNKYESWDDFSGNQGPPTSEDECEDDGEKLEIEEEIDASCYDPSEPASTFSQTSETGLRRSKYLDEVVVLSEPTYDSDAEVSPRYNPLTSTEDYQNIGTEVPSEYLPTPKVLTDANDDQNSGCCDRPQDDSKKSPNKSKHKDKRRHKHHHSKDKHSSKDKSKHHSSSKEKHKSHKDKRKDSPRKHKCSSKKDELVDDGLDRRRTDYIANEINDLSEPDNICVNGHDSSVQKDYLELHSAKQIEKGSPLKSSGRHNSKHRRKDIERKDVKDHSSNILVDHKSPEKNIDSKDEFGEALMELDESNKKKKSKNHVKSKDVKKHNHTIGSNNENSSVKVSSAHISEASTSGVEHTLPLLETISPNYKPLPRAPLPDTVPIYDYFDKYPAVDEATLTQEQVLDQIMISKGKSKSRVYAGKSKRPMFTKVMSLFELSIKCLQDNMDAIEYTGGVPYDLLKPVLTKASPVQLFNIERYNHYLLDNTGPLWLTHCERDFKGQIPGDMETYRDLYLRLTDEREQKLKHLREKSKAASAPVMRRTTQLAFVDTVAKPPKNVARAQAKYGTAMPAAKTKAAEIQSRKQAMQNAAKVERNVNGAAVRAASAKKSKAPLMAKAMQAYKKTFRR